MRDGGTKQAKKVGGKDKEPMFILFPKLPAELRIKVWQYAIADIGPRVIEIMSAVEGHVECGDENNKTDHVVGVWWPLCVEDAPALFEACEEARTELCKSYQPFTGSAKNTDVIFCDFSKDYICITYPRLTMFVTRFFADMLPENIRKLVRRLIMDEDSFKYLEVEERNGDFDFKFVQLQLEELAIVLDENSPNDFYGDPQITEFKDLVDKTTHELEVRQELEDRLLTKWKNEYPAWQPPLLRIGTLEFDE